MILLLALILQAGIADKPAPQLAIPSPPTLIECSNTLQGCEYLFNKGR